MSDKTAVAILVAEDDADDRLFIEKAFKKARLLNEVHFVGDGEELLDYLRHQGAYAAPGAAPRPGLILLDLNMPRKDGRTALEEMKADPSLRRIPVVVLTTSKADQDVLQSYDLGVSGFIVKPVRLESLIEVVDQLGAYWFQLVQLPKE